MPICCLLKHESLSDLSCLRASLDVSSEGATSLRLLPLGSDLLNDASPHLVSEVHH